MLRNDGFGATLLRADGSLWFYTTPGKVIIRASASSGGPGRLSVSTRGQSWTSARVNGKLVVAKRIAGQIVFDLPELAGRGTDIELGTP